MSIVTKLFLFASAVVMAVFMSCDTRHIYPRSLLVADSLAECNVDSALALLDTIADSAHSMSLQDSMYYALLRVKARDKAYQPNDTTDGILSIVSYYEHGGDRRLLPTAYYYAASAYRDMNKPAAALRYLYNAIDVAEEYGDVKIMSLCHAQIANLLYMNRLYEEAMNGFRVSLKIDSARHDVRGMAFGLRDIANCYRGLKDEKNALHYMKMAHVAAEKSGDKNLFTYVNTQMARLYYQIGDYETAEKYINVAISSNDSTDRSAQLSIASAIYMATGREDRAFRFDQVLARIGNVYGREAAHERLSKHYSRLGMIDSAIYHLNLHKRIIDSLHNEIETDNAAEIKANVELRYKANEQLERKLANTYVLIAACMVVVALVIVMLYVKSKRTPKNTFDMSKMPSEGDGPENVVNNEVPIDEFRQSLDTSSVVMKIKHIVNDKTSGSSSTTSRLTHSDWVELDEMVNEAYPGFKQKLLDKTRISELEYRVCLLIKVNVPPADIARLTYKDSSTISNIRRRLYRKYFGEDGKGESWDSFIHAL